MANTATITDISPNDSDPGMSVVTFSWTVGSDAGTQSISAPNSASAITAAVTSWITEAVAADAASVQALVNTTITV